jgi:hypothetical protein
MSLEPTSRGQPEPHEHGRPRTNPLREPHVIARLREFIATEGAGRPGKPGNSEIAAMVWREFKIPCNPNKIAGTLGRERISRGGVNNRNHAPIWPEDRVAKLREMFEARAPWDAVADEFDVTVEAAKHKCYSLGLRRDRLPSEKLPSKPTQSKRAPRRLITSPLPIRTPLAPHSHVRDDLVPKATLPLPPAQHQITEGDEGPDFVPDYIVFSRAALLARANARRRGLIAGEFPTALPRLPVPTPIPKASGRVIECQWLDGNGPFVSCPERSVPGGVYCRDHDWRAHHQTRTETTPQPDAT